MSIHKIYIFTGAVHSGKTTTLQEWLRNKPLNAGGILAPDKGGKRCLYDIARDHYYNFEMNDDHPSEDTLMVGKYRFSKKTFEIAQEIMLRTLKENPDWMIVDELGKLELEGLGLEPALTEVINFYKGPDAKGRLILVVRDHLRDNAIDRYGLNTDMTLHKSFFE
jgi:nucleoside-triphosphatase